MLNQNGGILIQHENGAASIKERVIGRHAPCKGSVLKLETNKYFFGGSMKLFSKLVTLEIKRATLVAACATAVFTGSVLAEPTLYPNATIVDSFKQVKKIPELSIMADEVHPKIIWVLPPKIGSAKVSSLVGITSYVDKCEDLKILHDIQVEDVEFFKELQRKIDAEYKQLIIMQDKAIKLNQDAEAIYAESDNVAKYRRYEVIYKSTQEEISKLLSSLNHQTNEDSFDAIEKQITVLEKQNEEVFESMMKLYDVDERKIEEYKKLQRKAEAAKKAVVDKQEFLVGLNNAYLVKRKALAEVYESYSKYEMGSTTLTYDSNWDQLINKLSSMNPGYSFHKIKSSNAIFSADVMANTMLGSAGIIRLNVPGSANSSGQVLFNEFPEKLQARAVMSVIGGCPIMFPGKFSLTNVEEIDYGVTIGYDIESIVNLQIEARYNYYRMYKRVQEHKKKGGIFSGSSSSTLSEKTILTDSLDVTFNDPENIYPVEDRVKMVEFMRSEVIKRFILNGIQNPKDRAEFVSMISPGSSGAQVLAEQLEADSSCQSNAYCRYSAMGLHFLNAAFGSSRSMSSYTNEITQDTVERYSQRSKFKQSFVTSFPKSNWL
jgi:hypothetical protein